MPYVYRYTELGIYTTGFYDPEGVWCAEDYFTTAQAAAERVHWLNGGDNGSLETLVKKCIKALIHSNLPVENLRRQLEKQFPDWL